jgi:hypothetical protein
MADIGVNKQWLVSPTKEIEDMWIQVQIQEKQSRIVKHKQDLEDLMKGEVVRIQALIKMLELEKKELESKLAIKIENDDVCDPTVKS